MYAVKMKSGNTHVFINKQSCETFMRDTKKKSKETLMEYKARMNKLIYFNPHSHNSY
jgi:hypothetical protein